MARTRRNVVAMGTLLGAAAIQILATGSARADDGDGHGDGDGGGHHGGGGGGNCLLRGTRIRTPNGERKIEEIAIGDLVLTRSGEAKSVRFVARRCYHRDPGVAWAPHVAPVRIARGALGANTPEADLFLSDRHALYFDGALIPVVELLNDKTIARYPADEFIELEYLHLKLAAHDVIYAEGAACDSLRAGSIEKFDNFAEYDGDARAGEPACAPILGFVGGRSALASRWRSAVSPLVDRRTHLDRIRDELEERAERWPLPTAA